MLACCIQKLFLLLSMPCSTWGTNHNAGLLQPEAEGLMVVSASEPAGDSMLAGALLARKTPRSSQDVPRESAEGARPAGKSDPRELQSSSLSGLGGSRTKTGTSDVDKTSPRAPGASGLEGRRATLAGRSGPIPLLPCGFDQDTLCSQEWTQAGFEQSQPIVSYLGV